MLRLQEWLTQMLTLRQTLQDYWQYVYRHQQETTKLDHLRWTDM